MLDVFVRRHVCRLLSKMLVDYVMPSCAPTSFSHEFDVFCSPYISFSIHCISVVARYAFQEICKQNSLQNFDLIQMYLVEIEPRICDEILIFNRAKIRRPLVGDGVILSVNNVIFAVVVTHYKIFPDIQTSKIFKVLYFWQKSEKA